ncbi:hypothetical protein [Microbacterium sp. NPDC057650]|uniref:hypothetical protein n=1 Tax=unclassified Microbacterium TaxID=2609290 RepID=UPI00366B6D1A
MTRPSILLERSAGGVHITCTACPHWHAFAASMGAAHQSASGHEARTHRGEYRARNAAKMYARRHPDESDTPTRPVNV